MKNLRLSLLTVLLSVALLGLIGVQFYWTNRAYEIARQRFRQATHEALQAVAQKLERREIVYYTQKSARKLQDSLQVWEQERQKQEQARFAQMEQMRATEQARQREAAKQAQKKPRIRINVDGMNKKNAIVLMEEPTFTFSQRVFNISQHTDSLGMRLLTEDEVFHVQTRSFSFNAREENAPAEPPAVKNLPTALPAPPEKPIVKMENKEDILRYLLREIQEVKPDLRQRLNRQLLDSLLRWELFSRGISLPYVFGVKVLPRKEDSPMVATPINQAKREIARLTNLNSYEKPQYLFLENQTSTSRDKILKSGFQAQLFPHEIVGNVTTLFVYFPQEINWFGQEMALTMGASVLFMGLIVGCFAYAIYTIWRQKKISEVTNDFINNMTHEFKTPVATVALACEALQDPDMRQMPSYTDRYLQIIKEENERLGRQVERVLQIAMLDKTDFKLKIQPCDIHEIAQKAIHKIGLQVESRQGELLTALEAQATCLQADEVHLTNVILNLLDNALKYSPDTPHITLSTHSAKEGIWLTVGDKGQGMTKEAQGKIFDKFYRVPTGNIHNVKGFGLGLSYVRTVVQMHHGRVSVQSEVGKGSKFSIFLPFAQGQA